MSGKRLLLHIQALTLIVYVFLVFLYAFIGYKDHIPPFMMVLQLVFALAFFCSVYISYQYKITISVLLLFILFSSLIQSFTLRQCYWVFTGTPFGEAFDVYTYSAVGFRATYGGFNEIVRAYRSADDYGFPTVLYLIYSLVQDEYIGQYVVLLFNSLAVTFSTYYIYRLMILLNIDYLYIRLFCAFFGFSPYFSVVSATGMKEIFFVFFITAAFYYMYKFKKKKRFFDLIIFLISTIICYSFRSLVPVLIVFSFFILIISNNKNKKYIPAIIVVLSCMGFVLTVILFRYILSYLDMDFFIFMTLSTSRLSERGGFLAQTFGGIFGPFPNFSRSNEFGIMYNSVLLYKVILSFPLLIGIYYLFKLFNYKYYPLIAYIGTSILVITLYGMSLNMRYIITCFPLMLPIIAWALQRRKVKIMAHYTYIVFAIGLIIAYNAR